MPSAYDLVFWQNTLSAHQAPLLRALSDSLDQRVLLVVTRGPSDDRIGFGWEDLDYGSTRVLVSDSPEERSRVARETLAARAHVFSGLGAYPAIDAVRRQLAVVDDHPHLAVVTESLDSRGVRGVARVLRLRIRAPREAGTVDTIFTIGPLAHRQFARSVRRAGTVVPFAYAVEDARPVARSQSDRSRLIFVGSLTEWKDPALILEALSRVRRSDWTLTLIGRGPLKQSLERQVSARGFGDRVRFIEALPATQVRHEIAESDVLILPSRYDGWGAVVSEALMSGTRVLVSDGAGASELVVSPLQGAVFAAGDAPALGALLTSELATAGDPSRREKLAAWAASHIAPSVMARYLVARFTDPGSARHAPWESGGANV
ncbi:glycosyltransferase [Leifsonia sp. NPDC080035]|uniref:Glycosyltransferase n=1 Tax=Leifsonia sp. NPDC080035 TaxID=3143936 RepID=A0AAU7GG07_9MICO